VNNDAIFLNVGSELVPLKETPYETEDVLQRALAEHPEVIAGPTTVGGDTGRLLLVRREMGVPGTPDGPSVWSVDHLFLDGDGIPVVVEVKRSTDTRIRREVVGQMLDYAANGTKYWPVTKLRQTVETNAASHGLTDEDPVTQLWPGVDVEEYWRGVQTNLEGGRMRMIFVADRIPAELGRIIEFLNEQMTPAEVLGVEMRQYVGGGHVAYVPRVIGQTTRAQDAKSVGGAGQLWTEQSLLDVARERRPSDQVALIERLLSDVRDRGVRAGWGKGVTAGASGWYLVAGQPAAVWNLNVGGDGPTGRSYLYVYLADLAKRLPADTVEEAADVLAEIPAMAPKIAEAREAGWNKYPSAYLPDVVASPASTDALFRAISVLIGDHQPSQSRS
jgi:hypothetical protein